VESGLFDINAGDSEGNSALMVAGNRKLVGAVVRAQDPLQTSRILLKSGAKVNIQNKVGNTALHQTETSTNYIQLIANHQLDPVDFYLLNNEKETSLVSQAKVWDC